MQLVHVLAAETHIFQFELSIQCKWKIIPVNNNKKSTDLVESTSMKMFRSSIVQ